MRSSKSRSRNKSNRQRTLGNIVNRVFDSSGPEGKVRGTPQQIIEKYLALARDAQLSNDRVAEQSFLQHAEHYTRMLGEAQKEMAERQPFHRPEGEDGRDTQPNGNGSHQPRDNGGREDYARDNTRRDDTRRDDTRRDDTRRDDTRRDDTRRDNGGRENAPRENARENSGRDQGGRDQGREQGNRDQGSRDQFRDQPRPAPEARQDDQPLRQPEPEPAPVPVTVPQPQQQGLPDAVATVEDEAAGLVETPEAAAKPARSRAPRAPRGEKPSAPAGASAADGATVGTPRPRRRKAAEGEAKPQATPAIGDE